MPLALPAVPTTLLELLYLIIALVILWVIISVPVYFAGKAITSGKATFGQAMGATFGGGLVYFIIFFAVTFFLSGVLGSSAPIFALILAILGWLAVYRASFDTSWIGAIGIVIVAWVILVVLDFFLVQIFGVIFPNFLPF